MLEAGGGRAIAPRRRRASSLTDFVHAHGVGRVSNHLLRQVHLRELGGQQQVFGGDGGAILGGGVEELLQPAALPVVRVALLSLCTHLLLSVPSERRLAIQAASTAHRSKQAGHGHLGCSLKMDERRRRSDGRRCAVQLVGKWRSSAQKQQRWPSLLATTEMLESQKTLCRHRVRDIRTGR